MTLAAGTKLGPYEVLSLLGAGGMGEVWRARDTRLGRDVAIKLVHPRLAGDAEQLRRFEQEARAAAQLDHPNIVVVHDVGAHEGSPYIVSELLQGEPLREKLGTPLPPRRAVEWAVQAARGLAAAHEKGIVHRDLKPENLFVTKDGHVKILDFGVAKLTKLVIPSVSVTEAPTAAPATEPSVVMGTVGYISPEQIRGQPVDARTDLFSFGVVLYEMLAGKRPFQRGSPGETMSAILRDELADLAEINRSIPAALEDVVRHCLEKDPEARFQSARDVAFALEALRDVSATTQGVPMSPTGIWLHRHRTLLTGTAIALILVVAGALVVIRQRTATSKSIPSVLALPCKVYGAPEVAYLTDAVPGTISTLLSQVEGIDTKVPPTSFEVEKVKGDLKQLADLYQVSSFIVTSITTSSNRFALNVQLVDAVTRKVAWGRQFEGARDAYNDLARQAADGIRLAVRPAALPVPTSTVSSEIELALREGDFFSYRYLSLSQHQDFEAAMAAYKRALERDPSLAVATARISGLYLVRFHYEGEARAPLKNVETWARRALELDPKCGWGWNALAWLELHSAKPDITRQLEYALRAATYSPRDAPTHFIVSNSVGSPGAFSLELAAGLSAADLDPFFLSASGNVVWGLTALGRPAEALKFADRALRVQPEDFPCLITKGYALLKLGRPEEARKTLAWWEPQFLKNPNSTAGQMWGQDRFQLAAAMRDSATIEKLERHIVRPLLDGRADSLTLQNGTLWVSPALANLGRTDESIRILLRSVDAGIPPPYDFLLLEPGFQPLRREPRFERVLAASRDGAAKVARILGEARVRSELPKYLEAPLAELQKLLKETGARG